MPTTPIHALPWPLGSDTPDAPRDFQALAEATETAIQTATAGHARGTIPSQSIPQGAITTLTTSVVSIDGISNVTGQYRLDQPGYYSFVVAVSYGIANVGERAFVQAVVPPVTTGTGGSGWIRDYWRSPEGDGSASGTVYSDGTGRIYFQTYHAATQPENVSGSFWIKYVGA